MSRFAGRDLDRAYFIFCLAHIPISLLLDAQPLYPPSLLVATPFPAFLRWYLAWSRDPILSGVAGGSPEWAWMKSLIQLEVFFQVPCFFISALALWRNDKRIYPLLLAYGASTATAVIPTLTALTSTKLHPPLSPAEMATLLGSYIPFLLIPLGIALDMGWRLLRVINTAQERRTA